MKKGFTKKLVTALTLAFVLIFSIGLVACGSISNGQNSGSEASSSLNEQASSNEECEHQFVNEGGKEATCTENGYSILRCSLCGKEQKLEVVNKGHTYVDGKCSVCSIEKIEIIDGYIYFGEYPQTIKADSVTITETTNEKGYFLGDDGAWYAGVIAAPSYGGYTFSNNASVTSGTTYYFKVEPIKWQVLSTDGVTAKVVCASIIANRRFDDDSNNYAQSEIREWLNNEFYNQAFSDLQKLQIVTTLVDNSAQSTGHDSNPYVCEDTNDKVYLLSNAEVYAMDSTTSSASMVRERITSDYSRATGAWVNINRYYGNGAWWLRSPYGNGSIYARGVHDTGDLSNYISVNDPLNGVVPALQIKL